MDTQGAEKAWMSYLMMLEMFAGYLGETRIGAQFSLP
jgi:hypothetical protein